MVTGIDMVPAPDRSHPPCSPIGTVVEAKDDPQAAAMRMIKPLPAPQVSDLRVVAVPVAIG